MVSTPFLEGGRVGFLDYTLSKELYLLLLSETKKLAVITS
jgi:hypothetical protein